MNGDKKQKEKKFKKICYRIEDVIDGCTSLLWILILLFGIYWVYDAYQVFYQASDSSLTTYKPKANEVLKPELENNVAWVTMDDSSIDYPIMQGITNDDYLSINPYGEYSLSGSIFLDSRNSDDFTDDYNLLYGHHMENYGMFGALDKWLDEEYFNSHTTGTLTTTNAVYKLHVIAIAKVDAANSDVFKPNEVGLNTIKQIINNDNLYINKDISQNHILAMSTCTGSTSTIRTVLFCEMETIKTETKQDISKSTRVEVGKIDEFDLDKVEPVEPNSNVLDSFLTLLGWR